MKLRVLIPLAILALIVGGIYGYLQYNRTAENPMDMKADISVAAHELMDEFEKDENAANAKYNGKVIAVKGNIREVNKKEDGTVEVILATNSDLAGVACVCSGENAKTAESYAVGEAVVAKGTCTGLLSDIIISPGAVSKE